MKIAVIGGAGYVGVSVCRVLAERGHSVVAVTRANGRFLLEGTGARIVAPGDVGSERDFDVVVNLAYPNRGPAFEYPLRNRELLEMIVGLAGRHGRVLHISTQAVFGYDFDFAPRPLPVSARRDYTYIEAKIELENLLLRRFKGRSLDIVRLGNVWGPASPTWTAALTDKLLFGDAVGVRGQDGFSNVADVANIADYVAFLVDSPGSGGSEFHHLAEFGHIKWSYWVGKLAERLAVRPVFVEDRPGYPRWLPDELRSSWRRHSPFAIAREWMYGRHTGSLYRSLVRAMPRAVHPALKRTGKGGGAVGGGLDGDPTFLTLMSSRVRFAPFVRAGWSPRVDESASLKQVLAWMDEVGY